ncbi:hypothetical protein CRYUN_Cryun23aG0117200 [Craigia yunnanensis]
MSSLSQLGRLVNGLSLIAKEIAKRSQTIESAKNGDLETLIASSVKNALVSATDLAGLTKGKVREFSKPLPNESVVYFNSNNDGGQANVNSSSNDVAPASPNLDEPINCDKGVISNDQPVLEEKVVNDGLERECESNLDNKREVDGGEAVKTAAEAPVAVKRRRPRERKVPATPFSRAFGAFYNIQTFPALGAGLAWETVQESSKRLVYGSPNSNDKQSAVSPFLSEKNAERLALALCRMRGAALKLGQMLSIQDKSLVPAPILAARGYFASRCKCDAKEVHRAVTKDGMDVAMKIQYPGVADSIESDIENVKLHSVHWLTPPPDESYSLHRKLSGAFLACIKLGAVVPCRELLLKVYEDYHFGEDEEILSSASDEKIIIMKRVLVWVLSLWSVVGIGLSRSEYGLVELKAKESLLSYLEKDAVSPGSNSLMVPLTLIQGAASKGAVCLDGTPPGYHLDRGFGSGANSWLIQLEGGGWCNNIRTCVFRKTTRRGSSKFMEKQINFTGILSNKAEENPDFYNWNRVKLRYCDGASFAGEGQNEANQLYFRGQRIWSAAMEELMAKGMQNAEQALLSGCSAGGLASILHCDEFKDLFPKTTKVKCLSDAGLFLDATNVAGGHTLRDLYGGVVTLQDVQKNLPNTCTSQMDPTSCFFPQNLVANIKTPMFLLNAAYDAWQVQESLIPSSADPHGSWRDCKMDHSHCNSSQMQFLQDFRNQMLNAVNVFSKSNQNGLFINSCFAHCQSERQDTWYENDSPRIGNKAVSVSVGDWFFDRTAVKAIDCPYPCDNTCHNLVFNDVTSTITISQSTRLTFTLLNLLCAFLISLICSKCTMEILFGQ